VTTATDRLFEWIVQAVRFYRRDSGTAVPAAVILSIGLGANIAIFAVAYTVLLRPLPVHDQNRLVVMWEHSPGQATSVWEVAFRDFRDWQSQNSSFTQLAATGSINWPMRLMQQDGPVALTFAAVSGTFFDVLGARAEVGRTFLAIDDTRGSGRVAVISYSTWRDYFGSRQSVIGTRALIDDGAGIAPITIIGVMPAGFDYPRGAAFWIPIVPTLARQSVDAGYDMLEERNLGILYVLGRLRPGVSVEQARADMGLIVDRLTRTAEPGTGRTTVITPLPEYLFGQAGTALRTLIAAGVLVLALTCANAISLLLARLARDRRRLFIRIALGAERSHLMRQALAEGSALAAVALAGALTSALALVRAATLLAPEGVPRVSEATIKSPAVAIYALTASVTVAVLCGLVPLLIVLRRTGIERLSEGILDARTTTLPVRYGLVVAQTALAVLLLIAAMLTIRSFQTVRQIQLGFEPADLVTFDVFAPSRKYEKAEVNRRFYRQALERVRQLAGVGDVAGVYLRPFEYGAIGSGVAVVLEGEDARDQGAWRRHPALNAEAATPEYFRVMGIPLLQGRLFAEHDDANAPAVVIVSVTAANRLWPGQDPIGKRVFGSYDRPRGEWQTVVGVVGDARYRGITEKTLETLYKPYLQSEDPVQHFIVRPAGPALALVGGLRSAIREIDPDAAVDSIRPMLAVVDREIAPWRFQSVLFASLSALALLIAVCGLYATLAQHVAERAREISIRLALGARGTHIIRWLGIRVARLMGIAVILGVVAAAVSSRAMSSLLFGVPIADPLTYATVCVVVVISAVAGACLPLRHAMLLDPVQALRQE